MRRLQILYRKESSECSLGYFQKKKITVNQCVKSCKIFVQKVILTMVSSTTTTRILQFFVVSCKLGILLSKGAFLWENPNPDF